MNAYDRGFELFRTEPELLLIEVCHRASLEDQADFLSGYIAARRQRDEYQQEGHAGDR
jgi:hypothetical protein